MVDLVAYTDGACSGNPGPGGWGVLMQAKRGAEVIKQRELSGGRAVLLEPSAKWARMW